MSERLHEYVRMPIRNAVCLAVTVGKSLALDWLLVRLQVEVDEE